jgi:hypothetical protein
MLEHNLIDAILTGVLFTSPNNGYIIGGEKTLLKYVQISGEPETGRQGDLENEAVVVFPNPTHGKFQITNPKHQTNNKFQTQNSKMQVEMVDLFGNIIKAFVCDLKSGACLGLGACNLEFDISRCPSGIYFVRIYLENQTIVKKIVKI